MEQQRQRRQMKHRHLAANLVRIRRVHVIDDARRARGQFDDLDDVFETLATIDGPAGEKHGMTGKGKNKNKSFKIIQLTKIKIIASK
jgi:hypothetical protein